MCAERTNDWDKYLLALLFAVREVPQELLEFPFELLYGRNVRGPMQNLRELRSVEELDERVLLTYQFWILDSHVIKSKWQFERDGGRK